MSVKRIEEDPIKIHYSATIKIQKRPVMKWKGRILPSGRRRFTVPAQNESLSVSQRHQRLLCLRVCPTGLYWKAEDILFKRTEFLWHIQSKNTFF